MPIITIDLLANHYRKGWLWSPFGVLSNLHFKRDFHTSFPFLCPYFLDDGVDILFCQTDFSGRFLCLFNQ